MKRFNKILDFFFTLNAIITINIDMITSYKNSKNFPRPITYSTIEHKLPKQLDKIKLILFILFLESNAVA